MAAHRRGRGINVSAFGHASLVPSASLCARVAGVGAFKRLGVEAPHMSDRIPVTVLSGSLGAGKTTLLNHLLGAAGDRDIAVLVNDMGDVNVDAELIAEGSEVDVAGVTELSNGCICCELQDDLETAVVRLARDRSFDALVVESSGISEPAPVARLFTTESRVADRYRVDALVTVLDTRRFLDAFGDEDVPTRRGTDADGRPLSDLLVEQVEVSNVVLLNKRDLCSDAELDRAAELVAALQPDATTIPTSFSAVDPDRLVGIDAFDASELATLPGWKRALADADHAGGEADHDGHGGTDHAGGKADHAHRHPDEVYGVSSFTYRRRRPFHPERLAETLRSLPADVVRSKGTLWVAGSDQRQQVGQAGRSVRVTAQGPWIASRPPVERDMLRSNRPELSWHDDHGDRETAYVVIGTDLETDSIADRLDAALVTDEEWERARAEDELSGVEEFPPTPGDEVVLREP